MQFPDVSTWTISDWITAVLTVAGAATIFVTAAQKTIDPLREWAKQTANDTDNMIVEWFATVLDWLAAVLQVVKHVAAALSVRPASAPPKNGVYTVSVGTWQDPKPPDKPTPGAPAVLLLVICGASACATPLALHAKAAQVSTGIIDAGTTAIEVAAEIEEREALAAHETQQDARAAVDAVRAKFSVVERLHAALRTAHAVYVAAIVSAAADGSRTVDLSHALSLLTTWRSLLDAANRIGIHAIASPPAQLEALAEGGAR